MLKTLGIVQACCHARHFQSRAARKLGGRSVLEWVVRRATDSLHLSGVIVLACNDAGHCCVRDLVPSDVPIFKGTKPDSLGRFAQALEEYSADAVIRVRGDDLFVDPALIDRLVTTAEEDSHCDYVGFSLRNGRPAMTSSVGIYAEWFRAGALHQAARKAKHPEDRENVTRYIYSHPEKFNIRLLPAPTMIDREDVRLRIEMEEDWDHVLTLFEALGPEKMDWRRVADLLDHQPALRNRMAALNRVAMVVR